MQDLLDKKQQQQNSYKLEHLCSAKSHSVSSSDTRGPLLFARNLDINQTKSVMFTTDLIYITNSRL